MNLDEKFHKNSDDNYNEENESSDHLLQLNYKDDKNQKKINDNSFTPTIPTSKFKSFSSLNNKKKNEKNKKYDKNKNIHNEKGQKLDNNSNYNKSKTPDSVDKGSKKKSESSSYIDSSDTGSNKNNTNEKKVSKIIDFSSDSYESKKRKNTSNNNSFNSRNTRSNLISQPNNVIFPLLSNKNLISLKKNEIFNKEVLRDEKYKVNDLINKSKNSDNNSFFVSEPKFRKFTVFQRFNEDKVKYQKSVGFSLLRNNANNKTFNTQLLNYSNGNKNSYLRKITESIDKKESINCESNNNSNLKESFLNFSAEKKEIDKNIDKRRSVNITTNFNFFKNVKRNNEKIYKFKHQNTFEGITSIIHPEKKTILNININNNMKSSINRINRENRVTSPTKMIRLSPKIILNKTSKELLNEVNENSEIEENNNDGNYNNNNNNNNEMDKFKYPFRRVKEKKLTNSYKNNFHFFNKLLDRKYKMFETTKNVRNFQKHHTIMEISKIINNNLNKMNNMKTTFVNSLINNKNNYNLINKKNINKNYFENDIIISRSESMEDSDKEEDSGNLATFQTKQSNINNQNSNNSHLNKNEEKYLKKKRLKIIKQVELKNKSSYLYNSYTEELKNYFLKNCAVDKITENIFKDFEPLDNKIKSKEELEEEIEKCMKDSLEEISKRAYKYCFNFDKIIKLGKSLLKERKIKNLIKITNIYILDKIFIYHELLNHFEMKWNNMNSKEYYYKKQIINLFSSNFDKNLDKKLKNKFFENFDKNFYVYKERIRKDIDLNMNLLHLRKEHKNKTEKYKKFKIIPSKRDYSFKNFTKSEINSKSTYGKQNHLLLSEGKRSYSPENKCRRRSSEDDSVKNKLTNFIKIKNELGFPNRPESFEKFAKIYRISTTKKQSSKSILNKKKNNEDKKNINKKNKIINSEVEQKIIDFNNLKNNINNFNVLKNKTVFYYNNNNRFKLQKRYSKINFKKNKIQLDKKLKIDSMTIKFAGIDQLTKEASLIKTQEMEKDSPEAKIFEIFISLLQKRKIVKFDILMKNEGEIFNRIINKQEVSTGNTLLIYATLNNLKSIVELLLLKGADPNTQNKFGNSPLHIAYKDDNSNIINLLLEYGANEKLKNNKGLLPWQMSKYIN